MRKAAKVFGSFLLFTPFSLILGCVYMLGAEQVLSFTELPSDIQLLAMTEVGDGEIVSVEREYGFRGVSYGIEFEREGRLWDIEYSDSGKLIEYFLELDD